MNPLVLGLLLGGTAGLVLGVVLLTFGVRGASRAATARRSWVRVPGSVSDAPLGGAFGASITYPLPDGSPRTFRTPAVKGEVLRDGQSVELLVNPSNPVEAHLQGAARGAAPVILCVVGGIFSVTSVSVLFMGMVVLAAGSATSP